MKKFISMIIVAVAMMFSTVANAQSNYSGSSLFTDNWSVGINGGLQSNLHDWNKPQGAITGITLDKEVTPLVGFTVEANVGINNLANWSHPNQTHICNGTAIDAFSTFVDTRLNLTNALLGYNGARRFVEVEPLVGVGYGHVYFNGGDNGDDAMLAKGGVNVNLNLCDAWSVNVRPAVVWSLANGKFDSRSAVGQVTLGLTYHFKTSNGTRHIEKAKLYDQSEIDNLNKQINILKKGIHSRPHGGFTNGKVIEKIVRDTLIISPKVQFVKGSSIISPTSNVAIKDIADFIKDDGKSYNVVGYASIEGSEALNLTLSQNRAEIVKNELTKYGVNPDKLVAIGKGATVQFGDDLEDNRIVIIENK